MTPQPPATPRGRTWRPHTPFHHWCPRWPGRGRSGCGRRCQARYWCPAWCRSSHSLGGEEGARSGLGTPRYGHRADPLPGLTPLTGGAIGEDGGVVAGDDARDEAPGGGTVHGLLWGGERPWGASCCPPSPPTAPGAPACLPWPRIPPCAPRDPPGWLWNRKPHQRHRISPGSDWHAGHHRGLPWGLAAPRPARERERGWPGGTHWPRAPTTPLLWGQLQPPVEVQHMLGIATPLTVLISTQSGPEV